MRIIELFAGIGACSKALTNLGIDLEIVDAVEIDKYAIQSFNAIHNTNFVATDIREYKKIFNDIDIITHGSPCQDFSIAGKQAGGDKGSGTRSSLLYETLRIVEQNKPKYVLWENVKNLLSEKHRHNFENYISSMQEIGYNSYYKVLNAKDYGIPQNRERVYTVSIRKDIDKGDFKFPEKEELKLRLKDMLEDNVEEKYYISEKGIKYITNPKRLKSHYTDINADVAIPLTATGINNWTGSFIEDKCVQVGKLDIKGHDCVKRVYSDKGISPTLTDMQGGNRQPKIVEEKKFERTPLKFLNRNQKSIKGDYAFCVDSSNTGGVKETTVIKVGQASSEGSQSGTIYSDKGVSPTLCAGCHGYAMGNIKTNTRVRKLTPKECWRLMGFSDSDFIKAQLIPTSNTQLYKQAGNSIVVKVLEKIFNNLLELSKNNNYKLGKFLNKITLGDSYNIIKEIPDKSIDLIIIDPPYLFDNFGGGCFGNERKKNRKELEKIRHGFNYSIINELKRIMKKTNIYIFCSKAQLKDYFNIFAEENIDLLVWHKTNPIPAIANNYLSDLEYCFFAREKGVEVHCTYDNSSKMYESPMNKKDKEKFRHPTIKPLPFVKRLINNSSNEGDIVLDCFSGSGTTCVAAKELNRQYIGIEIDPEYHKISVDRLEGILANGQTSMFIS